MKYTKDNIVGVRFKIISEFLILSVSSNEVIIKSNGSVETEDLVWVLQNLNFGKWGVLNPEIVKQVSAQDYFIF